MQDILTKIRENTFFEIFVISLIVISSILIGVKTYDSVPQNIIDGIAAFDYGITLIFLFEILIRILAERRKIDFFKSGWNVFDFTIIVISAIPTSLFESVLILRMLRLIRVLRLITFVPQFKIIINSIFLSIPRVFYVLLFMFINFYIFAVAGVTFFAEVNEYNWGNVGLAMLTLFQIATLEAWPDLLNEAMAYNSFSWVFFVTFIIINGLILMNMIIGVIIDVVVRENDTELPENISLLKNIEARLGKIEEKLN